MVTAVIIDDQQDCIEDLKYLIKKHNLPVEVVAEANSGQEGLVAILKNKPLLVFLDVVMPGMSGFDMLKLLPALNFQLIICSSFDKFAIQAVRYSALDFLLKPVKPIELKEAISRLTEKNEIPSKTQINFLEESLKQKNSPVKKIALNITDGIELVNLDDIIFFESDGNYTTVHIEPKRTILVSKQIGRFEEMIENKNFFRLHNSYLVNMNKINKFIKSDGGYVVMENGKTINVARSKRDAFLEELNKI